MTRPPAPSLHTIIGPLDDAATPPLRVEAQFASDDTDPLYVDISFVPSDDYGGVRLAIEVTDNNRGDGSDIEASLTVAAPEQLLEARRLLLSMYGELSGNANYVEKRQIEHFLERYPEVTS